MGNKFMQNKKREAKKIKTEDFELIEFFNPVNENEKVHIYNIDKEKDLTVIIENNNENFEVKKIKNEMSEINELCESVESTRNILEDVQMAYREEKNDFLTENEKIRHNNYLIAEGVQSTVDDFFELCIRDLDGFSQSIDCIENKIEENSMKNKKLEEKNSCNKIELREFKKEKCKLENEIEDLRIKNLELSKENQKLKDQLNFNNAKEINFQKEKEDREKIIAEKISNLNEKNNLENENLQKKNIRLENQLSALKVEKIKSDRMVEQTKNTILHLENEIGAIITDMKNLKINEGLIAIEELVNCTAENKKIIFAYKNVCNEIFEIFTNLENLNLKNFTKNFLQLSKFPEKNSNEQENFTIFYEKIQELKNTYEKEIKILNLKLKLAENSKKI